MGAPIRLLDLKEKDKVLKIFNSWSREEREERALFQSEGDLLEALKEGELWGVEGAAQVLAGFLWTKFLSKVVEIQCLLVAKGKVSMGQGAALIDGLIWMAKSQEVTEIWLEVASNNRSALSFYEKCGFRAMGVRKKYYRNGADAINMSKPLNGFHLA